jgi:hypothetical protein
MSRELTAEQWAELLGLLSMDAILPLYDLMGVPVADPAGFQKTLRDVVREARRRYEADPDAVPPVAAMLLDRLDPADAERFAAWAGGVYLGYHADQPDWSAWDIVFSQWAYSRRRDLDFLPAEKRGLVIDGYRRMVDTGDVKARCREVMAQPLSDWDLEVFSRRGYGVAPHSGPCSTVEAIARIERLKKYCAEVWQALTPAEREQLGRRAQTLLDQMRVWMPGPLPPLGDLLVGW